MVYEDFHKVSGLKVNLKKTGDAVHKHRCKANEGNWTTDRYKMCGRSQTPGNRGKEDLQEHSGSNKCKNSATN